MRFHQLIGATAILCLATNAYAGRFFTNPTQVNLLEHWNPNGTYANTVTHTINGGAGSTAPANTNSPLAAVDFAAEGVGWRNSGVGTAELIARYTFPTAMNIGEVRLKWRNADHSPNNYTVRDNNGTIATSAAGPFTGTTTHTFTTRSSNYVEFEFDPASTNVNIFEMVQLGAFLGAGQSLAIDGTYNVLYEQASLAGGSFGGANNWDDQWGGAAASPSTTPGSATWQFSSLYAFTGAYLNHQFAGNANAVLQGATIEVSRDNVNWTTVFSPQDFVRGYMQFSQPAAGQFVRLSWSGDTTPGLSEITEFQLFAIPEPGSFSLLATGCAVVAVAARRRRNSQA